METFFYVIGGVLVLLALGISFLGMRSERFPSDGIMRVVILVVALVVAGTAYGAVELSQEEALHREEEQNREAATEEEAIATSDTEASGEPDVGGEEAPGNRQESDTTPEQGGEAQLAQGDPQAGEQVFTDQGCGNCHSLAAVGATGTVGPNLDTELAGKSDSFIETSIIDPNAEIAKGFSEGIMPVDYGDVLTPDDLANLVAFLSEAAGSGPESDTGSTEGG